jgi:hypothetical protein
MRHRHFLTTGIGLFALALLTIPDSTSAQAKGAEATAGAPTMQIPTSVQTEHEAIHSLLVEATQAPGAVGAAAKDLAAVLHPHFVREEQIALPPLGLLAPLAAGDPLPEALVSEALAMTHSLKSELPRMLEEHKTIRAAVEKLRVAAQAEQAAKFEQLAEQLALHARTEEDVLYPAAVLVGDIIRARQKGK